MNKFDSLLKEAISLEESVSEKTKNVLNSLKVNRQFTLSRQYSFSVDRNSESEEHLETVKKYLNRAINRPSKTLNNICENNFLDNLSFEASNSNNAFLKPQQHSDAADDSLGVSREFKGKIKKKKSRLSRGYSEINKLETIQSVSQTKSETKAETLLKSESTESGYEESRLTGNLIDQLGERP